MVAKGGVGSRIKSQLAEEDILSKTKPFIIPKELVVQATGLLKQMQGQLV